jgi:putative spermidine/putrescine transport system substrate-binding protein
MKKVRNLLALILAVLMAVSLFACGKTDAPASSPSAAPSDAASGGATPGETASGGVDFSGQTLVVCSWGGAIQEAQRKIIFNAFEAATGATIVDVTDPDPAKLKSMVDSGNMEIDVWDVDSDFVPRGIKAGLFEALDFGVVPTAGLVEDFITEYSVPSEIAAICISWNTDVYSQENHPKNWSEFFDATAFPGSRTLYTNPMSMFEVVLMADGVPMNALYPLDVDRVFSYLDAHRSSIIKFWESGAESVELVSGGDAALGEVWAGRVIKGQVDGQKIDMDTYGAVLTGDSWIIGKGSKNYDLANAFIAFATQADIIAAYAVEYPGNAPANLDAYALMSDEEVSRLASSPERAKNQVYVDVDWWAENYDAVYERFQEWKLK